MLLGKAAKRSCAGCERALLEPGDALTFRGDVPYGPQRLIQTPALSAVP
jgi:hypothetical protein